MKDMKGKVAIVTGAGGQRGIGRTICQHLAMRGADIVVVDIPLPASKLEEMRNQGWEGIYSVVKEVQALGVRAIAVEADITKAEQLDGMIAACIEKMGHIDILVNNAGIPGPFGVKLIDVTEEQWDRVINVNLKGTFLCTKAVARKLIEQGTGGKIVNLASYLAKMAVFGWNVYSVSKFGVVGLTQNFALELAKYKINVNAVCPGGVATEISDLYIAKEIERGKKQGKSAEEARKEALDTLDRIVPLGRTAQPSDVAKVVAFLASSDSDYMTGQAINVTGGQLMAH